MTQLSTDSLAWHTVLIIWPRVDGDSWWKCKNLCAVLLLRLGACPR